MRWALFVAILFGFIIPKAHAGAVIDGNVFYLSDSFTHSSAKTSYGRTLWDASFGFELNKKGTLVLAWNYGSMTFTDNPGTTTTLAISDMGPKLTYFMNRDHTWNFSFTYNLLSSGSFSAGGTSTKLRGTSMKADLAFTPAITDTFFMGLKLNYYVASFSEEITGGTSLAHVSDGQSAIYPSLAIIYRWE